MYESLSGYINRISVDNCSSSHDLCKILLYEYTFTSKYAISSYVEYNPCKYINLDYMAHLLSIDVLELYKMCFHNIYLKFGYHSDKSIIEIFNGSSIKHRKFCPLCLQNDGFYKLIWQVNEINECESHNIYLVDRCQRCNRKMPLIHSSNYFFECPYCKYDIRKSTVTNVKYVNSKFQRALHDWKILFYGKCNFITIKGMTIKQSLAYKLLYFVSQYNIDKQLYMQAFDLEGIQQIMRNPNSNKKCIKADLILKSIRKLNVSMDNFLAVVVPWDFIDMVDSFAHLRYCSLV